MVIFFDNHIKQCILIPCIIQYSLKYFENKQCKKLVSACCYCCYNFL